MNSERGDKAKKAAKIVFGLFGVFFCLAVGAAWFVPKIVGSGYISHLNAALTDIASVQSELAQFELDCGRYPTNDEGLRALSYCPLVLKNRWQGPYTDHPVGGDPWGNPYLYLAIAKGYALTSYGADGLLSGTGKDADIEVDGP